MDRLAQNRVMPDNVPEGPAPGALHTLVTQAQAGDAGATDRLFTTLYRQLRRMARREAGRLGPNAPLGATTLLHEAWLEMSQRDGLAFASEGHFMAYAARAMRGLVIDRVRQRQSQKRGGDLDITSLDTELAEQCAQPELLTDIDAALEDLAKLEPALAQVVDLKFFCGFSMVEIGTLMGTSERTAQRQWEKARTMLYLALRSS
jgi:RNA polymerase sigma factor (TIGR02999 family)